MKKVYSFEVHTYAPELNKIYLNKIDVTSYYKKLGLKVQGLTKNYKQNITIIRNIKNLQSTNKIYKVYISNSGIFEAEKINKKYFDGNIVYYGKIKTFEGYCKNIVSVYNTVKNHLKDSSSDNNKIFNLIVGYDDNKKAIYQNFFNICKIEKIEIIK